MNDQIFDVIPAARLNWPVVIPHNGLGILSLRNGSRACIGRGLRTKIAQNLSEVRQKPNYPNCYYPNQLDQTMRGGAPGREQEPAGDGHDHDQKTNNEEGKIQFCVFEHAHFPNCDIFLPLL